MKQGKKMDVRTRSFLTAILVIFVLMIAAYILTMVVPAGEYARVTDQNGNTIIADQDSYTPTQGGLPFWKWLLSPVLSLTVSGGGTLMAVIAFLLIIGGVFGSLEKGGLMRYILDKTTHKFCHVRYRLLALVSLLFMAMGAMIGSFEECVPMVPICVALAVNLGWDKNTGIGMSLLAVGCGFASGVCNPFTVGVAQELAGLPMFSGAWMRLLSFGLIYGLLFWFLYRHAKKVETNPTAIGETFVADPKMDKGLTCFVVILGIGIAAVFSSGFIPALRDLTMIIVGVTFLVAGIVSTLVSGMCGKDLRKSFLGGLVAMLPAVLMILMASSIRYTLEEAKVLDTLLYSAINLAKGMPKSAVVVFIYLLVLCMNFFISSGSAKAFMIIPLIVPMAQAFGISTQLCVLAYAFGDGFSNVLYPTNPALLISLGLADVSYGKWFKWSIKFQLLNLLLTTGLLLLGLAIGY